jgi:hypothetical protein
VDSLTEEQKQKVLNSHTHNVECALAFGEGLEAKDGQDYPAASAAFNRALQCDPDFDLARRELGLLPEAPLSLLQVALAVEASALPTLAAGAATTAGTAPLVVGGVAATVGLTAGIVCGTGNCGGGNGGGEPPTVEPPPGPEPPPPGGGEPPPRSPMQ